MRRVNILILILILAGMFLTPAFGDVPIEGMKQYNYQYHINNTEEYPEYMFLTSSEIWGFEQPSIVVNGTFGGGYKLDGFVLHAMKEADLDPLIKEQMSRETQETKNLTGYFKSLSLATSDVLLPISTPIIDTIPLSNLTVLLQIQGITDTGLNVTKIRTVYGFENGTTIDQKYRETADDTQPGSPGT